MTRKTRPAWMGEPSLATKIAKAVALASVVALVFCPFWTIVATSLASKEDVVANGGWVISMVHVFMAGRIGAETGAVRLLPAVSWGFATRLRLGDHLRFQFGGHFGVVAELLVVTPAAAGEGA